HARTVPPRPSHRVELPIPPSLEDLIMACLEKDPARRPQRACDLAASLAALDLREAWTAQRAERWWHTHIPQLTSTRPVAQTLLSREEELTLRPLQRGFRTGA